MNKFSLNEEAAIEATEFSSTPPRSGHDYKFLLGVDGSGVFWIPPFELAGGQRWGDVWSKFEDAPIHGDVLDMLGWDDDFYAGAGYGVDGEVQVSAFLPVTKFANQIFEWWPDHEYIIWDGSEVPLSSLEWFKSSNKKQKQRKRRNKNKQKSNVPYYYGPWWGGWNPSVVFSPGDFHSGGGTTENSTGGDFGGGGSDAG